MHRPLEFIGQRGIDAALALHPGHAIKRSRNDPDMEMGLTLAAVGVYGPDMTGMAMAFVHHVQHDGREGGAQFVPDGVCDMHLTILTCTQSLKQ